jgi:hypothetical protein
VGRTVGYGEWDQFTDLVITTPSCATTTSLNDLHYYWPAGLTRFEGVIPNSGRDWLTTDEMSALAGALSHPVRQLPGHY